MVDLEFELEEVDRVRIFFDNVGFFIYLGWYWLE